MVDVYKLFKAGGIGGMYNDFTSHNRLDKTNVYRNNITSENIIPASVDAASSHRNTDMTMSSTRAKKKSVGKRKRSVSNKKNIYKRTKKSKKSSVVRKTQKGKQRAKRKPGKQNKKKRLVKKKQYFKDRF